MPPRRSNRKKVKRSTTQYKTHCDNHPNRRAAYSFVDMHREEYKGQLRGLCQKCFDEERDEALRKLRRRERINRIKARRAKRGK